MYKNKTHTVYCYAFWAKDRHPSEAAIIQSYTLKNAREERAIDKGCGDNVGPIIKVNIPIK